MTKDSSRAHSTLITLIISLFSSYYSLSLNIFTPAYFISSTVFITLSSFAFDFLIFSNKFTSLITISAICVALTSSYSFFTNTLSLLFLSASTYQSGCLLRLLALPMLLPGICLRVKSNLDRYKIYLTCLQFISSYL